jgi:hypothetical protein
MNRLLGLRMSLRTTVWFVDAVAAALGWCWLVLIVLTGFSFPLVSYLAGDFFTHYANAPSEAREQFHWVAGPIFAAVVLISAWLRWHARPSRLEKGEPVV